MTIEEEIFRKHQINYNKIINYGFKKINNKYIYTKEFLNDKFRAIIEIDNNSNIMGKVIEKEFNEEYTNIRIKNTIGEFVNKVKNAYIDILNDIVKNCCTYNQFIYDQTNRLLDYITETYKTQPEFLWEKFPDYAVFRHNHTRKWFAIIMKIDGKKISKTLPDEIEIINVKIDPTTIADKLPDCIFPSYHMNKKYWISIPLNDLLADIVIINLINNSYSLIGK